MCAIIVKPFSQTDVIVKAHNLIEILHIVNEVTFMQDTASRGESIMDATIELTVRDPTTSIKLPPPHSHQKRERGVRLSLLSKKEKFISGCALALVLIIFIAAYFATQKSPKAS